jgi:hypothetical protein
MKIIFSEEYASDIQGTSCEICIDAKAMSDDEKIILKERTLHYGVNTANEGWKEQAIQNLKEQRIEFEIDAQKMVDIKNKILNIAVDVAKAV